MAFEDEPPGAAVLYLDQASGELLDCSDAASSMLGLADKPAAGTDWCELLGISGGVTEPLRAAITAGISTWLPPLLVSTVGGGPTVVGGWLAPAVHHGCPAMAILLRECAHSSELSLVGPITGADTLAVLGVDCLPHEAGWGIEETARCMVDIRLGLLQIVPGESSVGLPVGSSILVVLRDTPMSRALTIGPALLSHLHTVLAGQDSGALHARISLGLARMSDGQTPLEALFAANDALLLTQLGHGDDRIAVAGDSDAKVLVSQSINSHGMFSGNRMAADTLAYLVALTALAADPLHGDDYLAGVCKLTLRQRGVAAVAVYRRRQDDSFDYVTGALDGADAAQLVAQRQLPKAIRQRFTAGDFGERGCIVRPQSLNCALLLGNRIIGSLWIGFQESATGTSASFTPGAAALHQLARVLSGMGDWRAADAGAQPGGEGGSAEIDLRIEGYVSDNMEGAIDQAAFLARVDVPVAVIGPRGTGKLYVAKFIHQESGGAPEQLVPIECRQFRSRREALARIKKELTQAEGKTLVFKSPHLMNPDAQVALARQISSRILADTSPPRYLPSARFVALFPDSLEHLMAFAGLNERLASVFAGYPIEIPPLKDRKRAVMRWAHKILGQESALRDRRIRGFTPDAQQAMREYPWPGNISEMREAITSALDKTDKEWITPVDLGIFRGISADGTPTLAEHQPFLAASDEEATGGPAYVTHVLDQLGVALAEALHALLELDSCKPLGAWLEDEMVVAACERFRDDTRGAAHFLHTKPRNISRWLPKIAAREAQRDASSLLQAPRKLIKQWIQETGPLDHPPLQTVQEMLMQRVIEQCDDCTLNEKAQIMGVSAPTFQKRVQEILAR